MEPFDQVRGSQSQICVHIEEFLLSPCFNAQFLVPVLCKVEGTKFIHLLFYIMFLQNQGSSCEVQHILDDQNTCNQGAHLAYI